MSGLSQIAWDTADRRGMMREIKSSSWGFKELHGGVCTWDLRHEPLATDKDEARCSLQRGAAAWRCSPPSALARGLYPSLRDMRC